MEGEGVIIEVPELCYSWLTQLRCYMWASINNESFQYASMDVDLDYMYYTAVLIDGAVCMSSAKLGASDASPNDSYYDKNDQYSSDYGSSGEEYDDTERQLKYIIVYLSPLILFLSSVGNLFSVIILCKLCNRVWSSCVYLAIVSILDQIIILVWCGNNWIYQITYTDITNEILLSSSSLCKVYTFLFNYIFQMEKWLLVCLSVECFIAAKYPHRVTDMCTLSKAKAIVLLLTVILACLNMHFFWTFEVENVSGESEAYVYFSNKHFRCNFVSKGFEFSEVFEGVVWPITDIVIAQVTPLVLITVLSSLACYHMKFGPSANKSTENSQSSKYLLYPSAFHQLKVSVVAINLSYTVLTIPRMAITIYKVYLYYCLTYFPAETDLDIVSRTKIDLLTAITFMLEYVFLSIKFYILIVGCKLFREKFTKTCQLFWSCCKLKPGRPDHATVSMVSKSLNNSNDPMKGLIRRGGDTKNHEPVHYVNPHTRLHSPEHLRDISPAVGNDQEQTIV